MGEKRLVDGAWVDDDTPKTALNSDEVRIQYAFGEKETVISNNGVDVVVARKFLDDQGQEFATKAEADASREDHAEEQREETVAIVESFENMLGTIVEEQAAAQTVLDQTKSPSLWQQELDENPNAFDDGQSCRYDGGNFTTASGSPLSADPADIPALGEEFNDVAGLTPSEIPIPTFDVSVAANDPSFSTPTNDPLLALTPKT